MEVGTCGLFLDRVEQAVGFSEAMLVVCKSKACWKGRFLIERLRGILNSAQVLKSGLDSSHPSLMLTLDTFLSLSGPPFLYL